jgi:cytoskeletal protein RodZ
MADERKDPQSEHEDEHEPPRGALLITLGFLLALSILWMQVYLTLLNNGGIPAS